MSSIKLPKNASYLAPYIMVKDVDRSLDFYQRAFDIEVLKKVSGEQGETIHAELSYQGQSLMLGKTGANGNQSQSPAESGIECPVFLYLYCHNVDDLHDRAVKLGAVSLQAPEEMFWGDRVCRLQDPDNYVWYFGTCSGAPA